MLNVGGYFTHYEGEKMKLIRLLTLCLFFLGCSISLSVHAASSYPGYLDEKDLRIINLNNVSIIDSENQNTFPYSVKVMESADSDLLQKFLDETGDDLVVSRVFVDHSYSFKNIYVFITQLIVDADHVSYRLNVLTENNKGHMNLLHYEIIDANQKVLSLTHGPSDEIEHLEARADGSFFPIGN